jgi:alpha-L-fucosidase 2
MAIHPLRLIEYDSEKSRSVIDASIKDLEALGTDYFCGYSFAWLAELYCVQKNGEKARETLDIFWKFFCSPNGFHVNGDYLDKGYSKFKYRPFTLEGNFCAVDALQEMLLYSENGKIIICPAIPAAWKNLSFKLRAENGVIISASVINGEVKKVQLYAEYETDLTLERVKEEPLSIHLKKDELFVLSN